MFVYHNMSVYRNTSGAIDTIKHDNIAAQATIVGVEFLTG